MLEVPFIPRATRIRRRRAEGVDDTTDAIRAVACIRFVRLLGFVASFLCSFELEGLLLENPVQDGPLIGKAESARFRRIR